MIVDKVHSPFLFLVITDFNFLSEPINEKKQKKAWLEKENSKRILT